MDTLNASPAHTADNPLPDFDIDDISNKLSVGLRALQLVRKLRAAREAAVKADLAAAHAARATLLARWRSEQLLIDNQCELGEKALGSNEKSRERALGMWVSTDKEYQKALADDDAALTAHKQLSAEMHSLEDELNVLLAILNAMA